ncbi:Non-heme 11 kDa protein of cytochrome bc1 complex [Calocera cornea HHB12733]|uniref:Non-heme 11 kDa protein of cytochrome bc1 complex n=1 Tax=Calocera cornea HHB12733 TaxID=1353952 RepID=A0A165G5B6_9BASI|nr:Non-heme 11 kDa protein of cytochrome bc1 complex [Calocera cornea HHB12733]
MSFFSLLSSFVTTTHCEDQQDTRATSQANSDPHTGEGEQTHEDKEDKEEPSKGAGAAEGGEGEEEDKSEEEPEEEEPEEEEPEDIMPVIRDECSNSKNCAPARREFEHCEKKVHSGQGRPHEDCVEELFHMMHCVDNCSAPKLFAKLR